LDGLLGYGQGRTPKADRLGRFEAKAPVESQRALEEDERLVILRADLV
jgi:hypothetical protein